MKAYARKVLASAAAAVLLGAACPGAFGALEIFMQFADNELPNHMMVMGPMGMMMGVDQWMVMTPMSMMFAPGMYDEIRIRTDVPGRKWILVDGPTDVSLSGMLMSGMGDQWVTSMASVMFLGVSGMAPARPTVAECRYTLNGEALVWDFSGFTLPSMGPWSFMGVEVTLDVSGIGGREPKAYEFSGLTFSLIEEPDSGAPFSSMLPEPVALALLAVGGAAVLLRARRRR